MIRCTPTSFLSQTWEIFGNGCAGVARLNWFSEEGEVIVDGRRYGIQKHGPFSGRWSMLSGSDEIAVAQKNNAFTRTVVLHTEIGEVQLRALSCFSRTVCLTGSGFDAVIAADSLFSRRQTSTGTVPDFEVFCFAFWLTEMMNRRRRNSG